MDQHSERIETKRFLCKPQKSGTDHCSISMSRQVPTVIESQQDQSIEHEEKKQRQLPSKLPSGMSVVIKKIKGGSFNNNLITAHSKRTEHNVPVSSAYKAASPEQEFKGTIKELDSYYHQRKEPKEDMDLKQLREMMKAREEAAKKQDELQHIFSKLADKVSNTKSIIDGYGKQAVHRGKMMDEMTQKPNTYVTGNLESSAS